MTNPSPPDAAPRVVGVVRGFSVVATLIMAACATTDRGPHTAASRAHGSASMPARLLDARRAVAEAHRLVATFGEAVVPRLSKSPKGVMITEGGEAWLLCHQGAAPGWTQQGTDDASDCSVAHGTTQFPPAFQATFPAVDGQPTVIIGTPAALNTRPARYVLTLIHERLHQAQMTSPGYAAASLALDLHDGDTTGAWMLTFPFPYREPTVRQHLIRQARALAAALRARGGPAFDEVARVYLATRRKTASKLSARNLRYLEFQLWQEGVARYIEYRFASSAARAGGSPYDYSAAGEAIMRELLAELESLDPAEHQRVIFYPLGAGEAILLDELQPQWRRRYLTERFSLAAWFEDSSRRSTADKTQR